MTQPRGNIDTGQYAGGLIHPPGAPYSACAIDKQDRDKPHFGLVGGKGVFRGEGVMWMARWSMFEASQSLKGARKSVLSLAENAGSLEQADGLRLYAARIGALACLADNVKNTIMYQYALDIAEQPQYGPNMMDYDDNQGLGFRADAACQYRRARCQCGRRRVIGCGVKPAPVPPPAVAGVTSGSIAYHAARHRPAHSTAGPTNLR